MRSHYGRESIEFKSSRIESWIRVMAPRWLFDVGCNTGEFAKIGLEQGASVVALDQDHDSIDALYRFARGSRSLHVIVAQLDDLCGGRGWWGKEHEGLPERLDSKFDVVLMLALIHHLAIGASIPMARIAEMARTCTRGWAIVEWIGEEDVMLRYLCDQRNRRAAEFSEKGQREAFLAAGFAIETEVSVPGTCRTMALLKAPR